jgi:hypothetical protein
VSEFRDWLKATQPLLAAPGADKVWPCVVDGMELAWDAALSAAIDALPQGHIDPCAEAIRALKSPPSGGLER